MSDTATPLSTVASEGASGLADEGSPVCREAEWKLRYITLAGLSWPCEPGVHDNTPTLLVHGWLDNSLSFARLAPDVARIGPVHAIDLAGHGHSGHRPDGQSYLLMDYVADLAELVERYFQETEDGCVNLVGHSLGGIVCALYAATFPERARRLVMIDSLGAISRPASETVPQLRKAIKKRISGSGQPPVYPDIAAAARAREGGLSPLSPEAALTLSPRNLTSVEGGYVWRTDPRLRHPSPLMMTEEQVLATLEAIETPTLFIRADAGLLSYRKDLDARAHAIARLQTARVRGGHHCHLDGDTAPVADAVVHFLEGESSFD